MASTPPSGTSNADNRVPLPRVAHNLQGMSFETPAPDLLKLIAAWEEWERGEESPGKVISKLKTAGLPVVLAQLRDSGWTPTAS